VTALKCGQTYRTPFGVARCDQSEETY